MAKKKDLKNMSIAQLKEYMYKGSGKDKAVNELGYNPDVFVNQGIKKTVEWFYNSRNAKTI